jgi:tetratricopeptide (TPR) repeat protein
LFSISVLAFSCTRDDAHYPVLGKDPLEDIELLEGSDEAFIVLSEQRIRDAVLVHVDTVASLAHAPQDDLKRLKKLLKGKERMQLSYARGKLFNSTNYLYAATSLGLIREIYWIIPNRFFHDIPLAGDTIKRFLKEKRPWFRKDEIDAMKMEAGCLSGRLSGVKVSLCSIRTLPGIEQPVVLGIHSGYFPVYAQEYDISKLRALKWFFDQLAFRQLKIIQAYVSYGIEDGRTSAIHRYIGNELYEGLRDPEIFRAESPNELWGFRDMAENMLSGGEGQAVLEYLAEPLRNCYGFVYLGNILHDSKNSWKEKFLRKALDTLPGSIYAQTRLMLFLHDAEKYEEAIGIARGLSGAPDDVNREFFIGECYYMLGDKKNALAAYERGLSMHNERTGAVLNNRSRGYLYHLVALYEGSGQTEKAEMVRRQFNLDDKQE